MEPQFWPTSAKDWFYLIGGIATFVTAIIGFFYKIFIKSKLNSLNRRLHNISPKVMTQHGRLQFLKVYMDRADEDRAGMHEDIGKIANTMRNMDERIHTMELKWLNEVSEIKTKIAEVQTKQDVILARLDRTVI